MSTLPDILRHAARRDLLRRVVYGIAWGLVAGLGVAAAGLVITRLTGAGPWPGVIAVILAAAGVVAGGASGVWHRLGPLELARRLDRSHRLDDRISTAWATRSASGRHDAGFLGYVARDAERSARGVNLAAAVPLTPSGPWALVAILAVGLVAGHRYLPTRVAHVLASEDVQAERIVVSETLDTVTETLEELSSPDTPLADERAALEALEAQLAGGADPGDVRDASLETLDDAAENLETTSNAEQETLETLAQRFRGLDDPERPEAPMRADDLRDALRRGEFGDAADQLDRLLSETTQDSDATRSAEAERLRDLARDLEAASERSEDEQAARREALREALRDQGLTPEMVDGLSDTQDERIDEALAERGVDEETARAIRQDLEALRDRERLDDRVDEEIEAIRDTLDDAAHQLEEPATAPDEPTSGDTPPLTPDPVKTDPNQKSPPTPAEEEPKPPDHDDAPGEATESRPSPDGSPRETTEAQPSPDGTPRETSEVQPSPDGTPRETSEAPPNPDGAPRETTEAPPTPDGQTPTPDDQAPPPDGQSPTEGQTPDGTPPNQPAPGAKDPNAPDDESGASAPQEDPSGEPAAKEQRPGDGLRNLEERRAAAGKRKSVAQRLRDAARRMSAGQPGQDQTWQERWARESNDTPGDRPGAGGPPARPLDAPDNTVNVGGDAPGSEKIGEWIDGRPAAPIQAQPARGRSGIQHAQRAAERAVNEAAIPPRYHEFIKRYFERLGDTTAAGREGEPAPAPAADADGDTP